MWVKNFFYKVTVETGSSVWISQKNKFLYSYYKITNSELIWFPLPDPCHDDVIFLVVATLAAAGLGSRSRGSFFKISYCLWTTKLCQFFLLEHNKFEEFNIHIWLGSLAEKRRNEKNMWPWWNCFLMLAFHIPRRAFVAHPLTCGSRCSMSALSPVILHIPPVIEVWAIRIHTNT